MNHSQIITGDEDSEEMEQLDTVAARWDRWLRRLEHFIAAKDIKDLNQKKAMLLHCAGEEVYDLSDLSGIVVLQENTFFKAEKLNLKVSLHLNSWMS